MDEFSIFCAKDQHLMHPQLCFERCRLFWMAMNPYKSVIAVGSGILLGYVVSKQGMAIDVKKTEVIQATKAPQNVKELSRFVGQVKWHAGYIRYSANVCAPLTHLTKKDVSFVWDTPQEKPFNYSRRCLLLH